MVGDERSSRYMAVLGHTYLNWSISTHLNKKNWSYLENWRNSGHILTEKKIFRKKIIQSFQTKTCANSAKNDHIELCFFANILFLITQKDFLIKMGTIGNHGVTLFFLVFCFCFRGLLGGNPLKNKNKNWPKVAWTPNFWKVTMFKNRFIVNGGL